MSMSVSSSSDAMSYLQSLMQAGTGGVSSAAGADPLTDLDQIFDGSAGSGGQQKASSNMLGASTTPFQSGTLASLISLQGQSGADAAGQSPSDLFAKTDADGNGQISQSEFENALGGAGVDKSAADTLFGKLDTNGDGSISTSEAANAKEGHHAHGGGGGQACGGSGQSGSSDADGGTTQTTTNADGSTTTTTTYSDGSVLSATTAAPAAASGAKSDGAPDNPFGASLADQLKKLQSLLTPVANALLSVV